MGFRIFGKTIPLWFIVAVAIVGLAVAATLIGTVRMPWQITTPPPPPPPPPPPTASMSPFEVTLNIGTLEVGETKTVAPTKVADLTVENGPVDLTFTLEGDYSGFDEISITVQLVQNGEVKYEAVIEPTIVVSSVMNPSPTLSLIHI